MHEMVHNTFHTVKSIDALTTTLWNTIPAATRPAINTSTYKHWIQGDNKRNRQQGWAMRNKLNYSNSDKIIDSAIEVIVNLYRCRFQECSRKTRN